jgi:DNA-binding NarL/FixJ family response regulator
VARASTTRRPTVCLLSAHPLVLGELQTALAQSSARGKRREGSSLLTVRVTPNWQADGQNVEIPVAQVYVVDAMDSRAATEATLSAVLRAHPQSAVAVLGDEFDEAAAFALLRLGARGLIRYSEARTQLPAALDAMAGGNYWVPRAVLSRFVDSMFGRGRQPAEVPRQPGLSAREQQVMDALLENLSNKEIGSRLNISERTVKFHVSRILGKFKVQRRADLILRFYQDAARRRE